MGKVINRFGKKKTIAFSACLIVLLAAVIIAIIVAANSELKNVAVEKDAGYSAIASDTSLTKDKASNALKGYNKTEENGGSTYTKDNVTIHIKTDAGGKVTYKSYKKDLGNNVQSKISGFNESMIKIGMTEESALKKLAKYSYVYNLTTQNNQGKPLHIYYYGWTGEKAVLELVFTDGKLTYYTINSDEVAAKVSAPEVK